jgi:DNA-binding response OmpR family regulator
MWKILIVEDDESARELYKMALKDKAECDAFPDGESAIEAYSKAIRKGPRYDVILLDITLKYRSGIKVLEEIRYKEKKIGYKEHQKTPIIMVTGSSDKKTVIKACQMGCNDYIVKPLEDGVLLSKIEKVLSKEK